MDGSSRSSDMGAGGSGVWSGLAPLDRWMGSLRAVALIGGIGWSRLHAVPPASQRLLAWLFAAFALYSVLLYLVNAGWPGHLFRLYRAAMILDFAFIWILVRLTGGMASNFFLAFYLLIALHAFYFGLATGVTLAVAATVLYPLADSTPAGIDPSDLGLRMAFFLLVGICMGGVAERERQERRVVEQLNRELRAQQRDLQRAQEQFIRSERLATVGELAAGLAHDLRNPLAGISAALHVLDGQQPDGQRALLAEIQGQIARMNKTLTDLLWHARPPTPQCLSLDVNEVLERSLWFLPTASASPIQVVKQLDPNLPPLRLDPNLLHQAFLNILINAQQAMPTGGRLTLSTRRRVREEGAAVEVEITDTGIGIPREHLGHVFQPFFTTKAQGTGLGLAVAARIVEQHGGRIAVETAPGRGCTFRISLPIEPTSWRPDDVDETSRR